MSHSLGISKTFTAHQTKTPSQYQNLKQMTVYNMITINNLTYLMIYILSSERRTSWYEIMHSY